MSPAEWEMSPADRKRNAASEVSGWATQPAAEGLERTPQAQEEGQRSHFTIKSQLQKKKHYHSKVCGWCDVWVAYDHRGRLHLFDQKH